MAIQNLFTQNLMVLPYQEGAVDDYNDPTPGFGTAVDVRGYLEQSSADEENEDRETAVSGWRVFLPASTSVGHRDRIVYGAQVFEIAGTPNEVWNPRTSRVHHIEANLRLIDEDVEVSS